MISTEGMYWEDYDDQNSSDFSYVGYIDLSGKPVVVPITEDLAVQVAEVKRCNGSGTSVRVYR